MDFQPAQGCPPPLVQGVTAGRTSDPRDPERAKRVKIMDGWSTETNPLGFMLFL